MKKASGILRIATRHIGERYTLGAKVPKNNDAWTGPWDCAEFASWCLFQSAGILYGCLRNDADPAAADAYTGYWQRDVASLGAKVSLAIAAATPGAFLLRYPQPGMTGHIVISNGAGGTVEAHSSKRGVISSTLAGRRWDTGILVPGLHYTAPEATPTVTKPAFVLRLRKPRMHGPIVKKLQRTLKKRGYHPGTIDGSYGSHTVAAVNAFQIDAGLVPDGEAGSQTLKALGIALPR